MAPTAKKSFKPKARKLTKKQLNDEIRAFVSLCFLILTDELDFDQIVEKTGLHYNTVKYLFAGRVSSRTHCGTLQKLGYAAGLKLELEACKSKVVLVD